MGCGSPRLSSNLTTEKRILVREFLHWAAGKSWKSPNGMEDVPVRWEDHLDVPLRWTWLPEGRLKNTTSWHVMARSFNFPTFWICLVLLRLRFHDWLGVAMTPFWSFRQARGILLRTAPRHRLPDSMGLFENFRNVAESSGYNFMLPMNWIIYVLMSFYHFFRQTNPYWTPQNVEVIQKYMGTLTRNHFVGGWTTPWATKQVGQGGCWIILNPKTVGYHWVLTNNLKSIYYQ
jgi:hypothetical protein